MNKLDLIKVIIIELVKLVKALDLFPEQPVEVNEPAPKPEPKPEPKKPNPTPNPPTVPVKPPRIQNAKRYIPWQDRKEWARRLDLVYTVWRGEREYAAILQDQKAVDRLPHSRKQIRQWMVDAQESHAKSRRLQWRIVNERHRKFKDRSQVRKDVYNEMRDEMRIHTARYASIASLWPLVKGCDSIRCKIKKGIYPGDGV